MYLIDVPEYGADRLVPAIGAGRVTAFKARLRVVATALAGRRLVNVTGDDRRKGGVYEVMRGTLPYLRGVGVDVVWVNLSTRPEARAALEFFHVLAHGRAPSENWRADLPVRTKEFAEFGRSAAAELTATLRRGDVVVLNDTQAAPLAAQLEEWHSTLVWHAHIGTADRNELVDRYWDVVGPSVAKAAAQIFYRPEFAPPSLRDSSTFATPGIDPSVPKNLWMDSGDARAVLREPPQGWPVEWVSGDAPVIGSGDVVAAQLSRWDPLKDMSGVCRVFAGVAAQKEAFRGLIVGPSAQSAAERAELASCMAVWTSTSMDIRSRVTIGVIQHCGTEGHDYAVRVLQSAADIVMQKSLQEGFGLTVTEAMLRAKPVVATAVGGIPLQVRDGHNGVLVPPDTPDEGWIHRVLTVAADEDLRSRLGTQAREDVLHAHTVTHHLTSVIDGVLPLWRSSPGTGASSVPAMRSPRSNPLADRLDRPLPPVACFGDPLTGRPVGRTVPVGLDELQTTFAGFDAFASGKQRTSAARSVAIVADSCASVLGTQHGPDTEPVPDPRSEVQRYFRIRTAELSADEALRQCLRVIADVARDLADAPIAGSDLMRLMSAMSTVIDAFPGPEPDQTSAAPLAAEPADLVIEDVWLHRWIVGHQLHAMLNVYAAYALADAAQALRSRDHRGAVHALDAATRMVEGFAGARAHALAVPGWFYRDVLRPTMVPPLTGAPLTGRMHLEYRGYRQRLSEVMELLPHPSARLAATQPQLALVRERLLEADLVEAERHVTSVEPLVSDSRSLIQTGRSTENAVSALRRIRHRRAAEIATYVRFPDRTTPATDTPR